MESKPSPSKKRTFNQISSSAGADDEPASSLIKKLKVDSASPKAKSLRDRKKPEAETNFQYAAMKGYIKAAYPNFDHVTAAAKALKDKDPQNVKIASFDMDWTLIKTKLGNKFPKNKDDWELLFGDKTKDKLVALEKKGFLITIFTNQAGVITGQTNIMDLKHKFGEIQKAVGIPMLFIASTHKDTEFRKPKTGMWNLVVKTLLGQQTLKYVDMNESFYCGDAAGRKQKPYNDFSSDDLIFSINVGLKFYTPEMLFKGGTLNFTPLPGTCLDQKYKKQSDKKDTKNDEKYDDLRKQYAALANTNGKRELLLLVGSPGSGKSTFWREYLKKTHLRVNNDETGNPKKTQKLCRESLEDKTVTKSMCVDNTNPTAAARQVYLDIASDCGIEQVRCIWFDIPKDQCFVNNDARKMEGGNHMSKHVPKIAINMFFSRFEEPTAKEGYSCDPIKVQYVPFKTKEE